MMGTAAGTPPTMAEDVTSLFLAVLAMIEVIFLMFQYQESKTMKSDR
jgi:hypothetical protein